MNNLPFATNNILMENYKNTNDITNDVGEIFHTACGKSELLSWSHYRLLQSPNKSAVETDEDIARYSILHGNEQLFASKYKLYFPSEEELRREISRQKVIFQLQQQEKAALEEVEADE